MADIIVDGKIRIFSVVTIANIAAPTTGELNAGLDLTPFVPPDGFKDWKLATQFVPNTKINSKFDTQRVGRAGIGNPSIVFDKQLTGDTVFTTLVTNYVTNIVVRRYLDYVTAFASAQLVQVWPVEVGYRQDIDVAPNTLDQFEIFFGITSSPNISSVIA